MLQDALIEDYGQPGDREAFAALNLAWLEEFFYVEEEDKRLLSDPEALILIPGGHIFMARRDGKAVGTAALIKMDEEAYEFAKMGVDKSCQGQGIGRRLLEVALHKARELGAKKMLICTSSKLGPANALYRKVGFVDSDDPRHHYYDRADVRLEMELV